MVIYRYLYQNEVGLTIDEIMVYSAIISFSLMQSESFDVDGRYDKKAVLTTINEHLTYEGLEYIDLYLPSVNKLSEYLRMSRNKIPGILKNLRYKHHLYDKTIIVCPLKMIDAGYQDVPNKLRGKQALMYAHLKDLAHNYHGKTDRWYSGLKKDLWFLKDDRAAEGIIYQLKQKQLVERTKDNKLKIL